MNFCCWPYYIAVRMHSVRTCRRLEPRPLHPKTVDLYSERQFAHRRRHQCPGWRLPVPDLAAGAHSQSDHNAAESHQLAAQLRRLDHHAPSRGHGGALPGRLAGRIAVRLGGDHAAERHRHATVGEQLHHSSGLCDREYQRHRHHTNGQRVYVHTRTGTLHG